MKVLVVGSGGREHAIIRKLKESKKKSLELFACPGNGGISKDAQCIDIKATDIEGVVSFSKNENIDLVVVAPDDPLVLGMVDALEAEGIAAFGPRANAAIIEGSKAFSKDLMKKYNIPTAAYEVFSNYDEAVAYIKAQNKYPVVIKADGLALGKGVVIAESFEDASNAVNSMINDEMFGKSGKTVVVEEFLTGPEVSVLAFTDGKCVKPMISSMDHKRALDNDMGLNTGGMGTIAPNPFYTPDIAKKCMDTIFIPTIEAMNKENRKFKGCLYFGLMLTAQGPKVIEYNARFGDPETQVVLPLLKTDLLEIFMSIVNEHLNDLEIEWKEQSAACVIAASGGYPQKYQSGYDITGLDENGQRDDCEIFHAGTKFDGLFKTSGGRVIGITCVGDTLNDAIKLSYDAVSKISFSGIHYRNDIGKRALSVLKGEK